MKDEVRPPIGAPPQWVWRLNRIQTLAAAIDRYAAANVADKPCVAEWISELDLHQQYLAQRKAKQVLVDDLNAHRTVLEAGTRS